MLTSIIVLIMLFCFQSGKIVPLCLLETRWLVAARKWIWVGESKERLERWYSFLLCGMKNIVKGLQKRFKSMCSLKKATKVEDFVNKKQSECVKTGSAKLIACHLAISLFSLFQILLFIYIIISRENRCYSDNILNIFNRHKNFRDAPHMLSPFILLKSSFYLMCLKETLCFTFLI